LRRKRSRKTKTGYLARETKCEVGNSEREKDRGMEMKKPSNRRQLRVAERLRKGKREITMNSGEERETESRRERNREGRKETERMTS
jgi:hypothetical protein